MLPLIKRILTAPFVGLAALVIGFSEWLWNPLLRVIKSITRWGPIHWVENKIRALPSWAALLMFAIPAIALLPFKLAGLYFIAHGKKVLGLIIFVAAKVVGTGLLAWIYSLTETALERYQWFVALRGFYRKIKATVYERVKSSFVWQQSRLAWAAVKLKVASIFSG
jgi:hypothetical protein